MFIYCSICKEFVIINNNSMKFINVLILIVLCSLNSLNAQDTIQKKKIFRTWISFYREPFKINGILYEVNDSSLLVSCSLVKKGYSTDRFEMAKLNINNIETIKIRRNNNIGRGILFGTLTGFFLGGMVGLISGNDPPDTWFGMTAGDKAILLGVPLAVAGVGIGAAIGSIKVKIPINGSIKTFHENNSRLKNYSYRK